MRGRARDRVDVEIRGVRRQERGRRDERVEPGEEVAFGVELLHDGFDHDLGVARRVLARRDRDRVHPIPERGLVDASAISIGSQTGRDRRTRALEGDRGRIGERDGDRGSGKTEGDLGSHRSRADDRRARHRRRQSGNAPSAADHSTCIAIGVVMPSLAHQLRAKLARSKNSSGKM